MIVLRTSDERFARFGIFQIFNLKNEIIYFMPKAYRNLPAGQSSLCRRQIITLPSGKP